jgi:hypothetical protein
MDLQSTALTNSATIILGTGIEPITYDLEGHRSTNWANRDWRRKELNFQPLDFQSSALPLSYVV